MGDDGITSVRISPLKFVLVLSVILLILFSSQRAAAYSEITGVELGDIVDIEYEGKFENGTVFDAGRIPDAEISVAGGFIPGFYKGIVGMKIGEDKTIVIPAEEAYTNPARPLYGLVLIFNVHLYGLYNPDGDTKTGGEGSFTKIINVLKWIAGIGVTGFVIFSLNQLRIQKVSHECVHCQSLGRKTVADGKCGKCGNAYCRKSFSRGCPNCKANSFVPSKGL